MNINERQIEELLVATEELLRELRYRRIEAGQNEKRVQQAIDALKMKQAQTHFIGCSNDLGATAEEWGESKGRCSEHYRPTQFASVAVFG
jgi:hypothetical protein